MKNINPMVGNCKFADIIFDEVRTYFGSVKKVIELGCGCGKNLAKFINIESVVGVDPFLDNVNNARRIVNNGQIFWADHRILNTFLFNQFDVGYTCSVLDHMEDFVPALKSLCRICQNVILFEPIVKGLPRQATELETNCWETSWYHDYSSWLSSVGLKFDCVHFPLYASYSGAYFHRIIIYSKDYRRTQ